MNISTAPGGLPHVNDPKPSCHQRPRRVHLAVAVRTGRHALAANRAQLQTIVDEMAPGLTERRGIGAVTAAQAIVSYSHPGRCRNDAAFAALSGTSPLEASSGKTVRHRLNRGGDRALNCAIHTIALTRMRCCPTTKEYVARRTAEGKSSREIQRCLKRYIARALPRSQRQHYVRRSNPDYSGGHLTNIEASEGWEFESLRVRNQNS